MKILQFVFLTFTVVLKVTANELNSCLDEEKSTAAVVTSNDTQYTKYNYQWNLYNLIYPRGFIVVKSAEDVQKALRCGSKLNLSLSVNCGGNSFEKYSFGSANHWVIDLSNLNLVDVDEKSRTAVVGAGVRFVHLSEKLWNTGKYGVTVGTCLSVCVSGFSLGGGFGMSTRRYGPMVDNTVELEMVTVEGEKVIVNANENPDLFWALRGAGASNFGIVTKFKYNIFNASHLHRTIKTYYSSNDFAVIFGMYQNWLKSNPDPSISSIISYYGEYKAVEVAFVINEPDFARNTYLLQTIRSHFPYISDKHIEVNTYMQMLQSTSTEYLSPDLDPFYYAVSNFYVKRYLNSHEIAKLHNALKEFPLVTFLLETYGGKMNQKSRSETAFTHRDSLYVLQYGYSIFAKGISAETAIKKGEELRARHEAFGKEIAFIDSGESYQNYLNRRMKDWQKRFYGENYERLQEIKKKWNPRNILNYPQAIEI